MANRKIKGIVLEIGGDTSGLQKALTNANSTIKNTQTQLKDVNNLLKFDPTNTVLVAQKQQLLTDAVDNTTKKLNSLEDAQKDVQAAMEAGKIGTDQYMAFQREIEETRAALNRYETELSGLSTQQERLATGTDRLNKLLEATDSTVDDYADALGSRLVTAIKNGSASSDQLRLAVQKIGKAATDGKGDIDKLTQALDTVDDGQAIKNLIEDMKKIDTQADETSEHLENMGSALTGEVMMEAADQVAKVGDKIIDLGQKATDAFTETQDATVKASAYFGETGEAAERTAQVIQDVYTQGVGDSMDAVSNAVITVKKNITDLNDSELTHLTEQAITLEELYGIDMNESLRGVNSLMEQYGITAQEAMDYLVAGTQHGLDKTNELGDNLSEYAGKFAQAGYSAQEYFQLLQNGLNGGAYNLDKVNDAINEVTNRLADGSIADSMSKINTETGELEAGTGGWGQEVEAVFQKWQAGGATQKEVIDAIVKDIQGTENQQQKLNKAALAFGTMGEDGNAKFIESLTSVGNTYDNVKGSAEQMFDSSTTEAQTFEGSMRQLEQNLQPLGEILMKLANDILPPVVDGIGKFAEFFGNLPQPVQDFVLILGGLLAALTALMPVIATITAVVGMFGAATVGPIILVIMGVVAAIALVVAAIKNWGAISEWFGNLWQTVKDKFAEIWDAICGFFTETIPAAWDKLVQKFQGIPEWWSGIWTKVKDFFSGIWDAMMDNPVLAAIATTIKDIWTNCVETLKGIWTGLKDIASGAWELIKNVILGPILLLIDLVTGNFDKLKTDASNIWNNIKNAASTIWNGIKTVIGSLVKGMVNHVVTLVKGFKDTVVAVWTAIKTKGVEIFKKLVEGIKEKVSSIGETVKKGFQAAIDFITSLPGKALEWGADFINGLAEGIRNAISSITDAVSSVADTIRSFLHFSVPDEGPLTEYESWMPDFMQGLAKGINKSKSLVTDAIAGVSKDMSIDANAMVEQSKAGKTSSISAIVTMLTRYLPYLAKATTIEWDTGGVAAKLARNMNKELGNLAEEEAYL